MKYSNHIYLVATLSGLLFSACQNEELMVAEQETYLELNTPTRVETRTSLQNETSVVWNEGDVIAVYDYASPKRAFEATVVEGTTHFKGKISARHAAFIAVYPFSAAAENDKAKQVVMQLSAQQTAVQGTFGPELNIAVAKGERNVDGSPSSVRFRNICQLLKLSVPAYTANRIAQIEFITDAAVAGELTIDYQEYNPTVNVNPAGSKSITLLPPAGTDSFAEGTYYIVATPNTINGFTLKITDKQGKVYSQHSSRVIDGESGVICNLGYIDMVDRPVVTPKHHYESGVLKGTLLTLTAPVSDKEWSAIVKNEQGETVRTLAAATGTLTSDHTDVNWPYLPKGTYSVDYTYTTANGKQMNGNTSFQITEDPQFSVSLHAASSYSYYKGDGVTKDVNKANTMDKYAVEEVYFSVDGIEPSLMIPKYGFSTSHNIGADPTETVGNRTNFPHLSINQLGENTLSASATFDGVNKTGTKSIWITGLPFDFNPPVIEDWKAEGKISNETDHILFGKNGTGSQMATYEKVNIPTGIKLNLNYRFVCRGATVGTFFTISVASKELVRGDAGFWGENEFNSIHSFTSSEPITDVRCYNNYGAAQTHSRLYQLSLTYSN